MASEIIQGDPVDDRLNIVDGKLDEVHRALNRVQGTEGVVVTEKKLEILIEAVQLLSAEVRLLRDSR